MRKLLAMKSAILAIVITLLGMPLSALARPGLFLVGVNDAAVLAGYLYLNGSLQQAGEEEVVSSIYEVQLYEGFATPAENDRIAFSNALITSYSEERDVYPQGELISRQRFYLWEGVLPFPVVGFGKDKKNVAQRMENGRPVHLIPLYVKVFITAHNLSNSDKDLLKRYLRDRQAFNAWVKIGTIGFVAPLSSLSVLKWEPAGCYDSYDCPSNPTVEVELRLYEVNGTPVNRE